MDAANGAKKDARIGYTDQFVEQIRLRIETIVFLRMLNAKIKRSRWLTPDVARPAPNDVLPG